MQSTEEEEQVDMKLKLTDIKNLLYLSKIAAFAAGKDAGTQVKVDHIEADLKVLKLQEKVMKCLTLLEDKQLVDDRLLHPEDLIKLCLEGEEPELLLWTFDAFAWTSSSFRKTHRKLLEDCWKKAASQDDWSRFHDAYTVEALEYEAPRLCWQIAACSKHSLASLEAVLAVSQGGGHYALEVLKSLELEMFS